MNESGVSQQSTVSLFWSDYKSSLDTRRLNIDCSYCSESQEAEVAQGTGLLQVLTLTLGLEFQAPLESHRHLGPHTRYVKESKMVLKKKPRHNLV